MVLVQLEHGRKLRGYNLRRERWTLHVDHSLLLLGVPSYIIPIIGRVLVRVMPAPDGQGAREGDNLSVLVHICALIAHVVEGFHSGVQLVQ